MVGIRCVHFSCCHSYVYMARVPHNSPEVPRMSPHPRLDSTPSESTRKGPAGCSPCSPCPYQTLLSQAACSPHCRRKIPPETRMQILPEHLDDLLEGGPHFGIIMPAHLHQVMPGRSGKRRYEFYAGLKPVKILKISNSYFY